MIHSLDKLFRENITFNIYGAGKRGRALFEITERYGHKDLISCFIVKDAKDNPADINGIPVRELTDPLIDKKLFTFIALADKTSAYEAQEELKSLGYINIKWMTSDFWEMPEFMAAKEYLEELDTRVIVQKKEHDEFGFCHVTINERYQWRFYYTHLKTLVTIKEDFFPKNQLLECFEEFYGRYLSLSETILESVQGETNGLASEGAIADNESGKSFKVFRALGAFDKALLKLAPPQYVIPIQVGAALTDERICELTDDTGDNISALNKDFSECTALYWCWKNVEDVDYIGFFHYARFMDIPGDDLSQIAKADIDILLTTPMLTGAPIKDFFCPRYIPRKDWRLMEGALLELYPEYESTISLYNRAFCYPGANLSIMKKDIFDEYASFAFSVMDQVTGYYRDNGIVRQDRYAGYLMENLLAIFVMHNKDRFKIAYTDFFFAKQRES